MDGFFTAATSTNAGFRPGFSTSSIAIEPGSNGSYELIIRLTPHTPSAPTTPDVPAPETSLPPDDAPDTYPDDTPGLVTDDATVADPQEPPPYDPPLCDT